MEHERPLYLLLTARSFGIAGVYTACSMTAGGCTLAVVFVISITLGPLAALIRRKTRLETCVILKSHLRQSSGLFFRSDGTRSSDGGLMWFRDSEEECSDAENKSESSHVFVLV
jgi:hypothetical protein